MAQTAMCRSIDKRARRASRQFRVSTDYRRHRFDADHSGKRNGTSAGDHGIRLQLSDAYAVAGSAWPGGPGGAGPTGPTWQQQVLAKGWGYAIVTPNSIQADNGRGLTRGIIGLVNKGQPRKPDDWGALRAWAWAPAGRSIISRRTKPSTRSRSASRACRAMARRRWWRWHTMSASRSASSAHRARAARNYTAATLGELVENLAGSGEYHWMAGNFLKYAGPLTAGDLPVDAHELIALCAPRPVFISYGASTGPGAEGQWVDQRGQLHGGGRCRPRLPAAGKEGLGHRRVPAGRDGPCRRRAGVPSAQRRTHHGTELADVPAVGEPVHNAPAASCRDRAATRPMIVCSCNPTRQMNRRRRRIRSSCRHTRPCWRKGRKA